MKQKIVYVYLGVVPFTAKRSFRSLPMRSCPLLARNLRNARMNDELSRLKATSVKEALVNISYSDDDVCEKHHHNRDLPR